jgi:nucleoside phosphorylase
MVAAVEPKEVPNVPVDSYERRTLVLTAFPVEADAVLSHTTLDSDPVVVADRRHFYLGSIRGKKVIVAMTGIGMVNATETTEIALTRFANAVGAVLFSGVAGGAGRIGIADVTVPARWTLDNGTTFHPVNPAMLSVAEKLSVTLEPVRSMAHLPQLLVGGDGYTYDNNNGQAFPGIPNGGGVFGCQPRTAPDRSLFYTGNFFQAAWPWLRHGLISNAKIVSAADPAFVATDNETAAAQAIADAHGVPFLGIRGISDGPGDPLRLPGFPFQFFVYKRVVAANAARVAAAFLQSWSGG